MRIYEIKESLTNTTLVDNIYQIQKLIQNITNQTEFITDINKIDFDYLNIILDRTKVNLQKVYSILQLT